MPLKMESRSAVIFLLSLSLRLANRIGLETNNVLVYCLHISWPLTTINYEWKIPEREIQTSMWGMGESFQLSPSKSLWIFQDFTDLHFYAGQDSSQKGNGAVINVSSSWGIPQLYYGW